MSKIQQVAVLFLVSQLALMSLFVGLFFNVPVAVAGGGAGACYLVARIAWFYRKWRIAARGKAVVRQRPRPAAHAEIDPSDTDALVKQMLAQGRYALLLRPQVAKGLGKEQLAEAFERLQDGMALAPDGEVVLGRLDQALEDGILEEHEIAACAGRVIKVKQFFLDRYPVTNRQFYEFVAAGGYEQMSFWDQSIWPAVLEFVDRTDCPGPRYWEEGCYPLDKEDHPVVGVCWHEANAYARWVGKRLPSDAEWVKAGSWPVPVSHDNRVQRKYPWGDMFAARCANTWHAGIGATVPVTEFADGVSVGGVHQMIGNVWEWTSSNMRGEELRGYALTSDVPAKALRGGAFDTYFENQATCHFQSADSMLARKPNIGFRCAVGVCDLVLARAVQPLRDEADQSVDNAEEIPA